MPDEVRVMELVEDTVSKDLVYYFCLAFCFRKADPRLFMGKIRGGTLKPMLGFVGWL